MKYTKDDLKKLVNTKLRLMRPTPTTTRNNMYKIIGYEFPGNRSEVFIINDNGNGIRVLTSRFKLD